MNNLDIQLHPAPYLQLGFHLDHHDGYLSLHLPGIIVVIGRIIRCQFDWSLRRFLRGEPNFFNRQTVGWATCGECGQSWAFMEGEVITGCPYCQASIGFDDDPEPMPLCYN